MIDQGATGVMTPAREGLTAADVMFSGPRTCSMFSRVIEAVMIFKDEDCGMVPIIEEGKPIGVVTDRDVALALGRYPDLGERPVSEIMSKNVITVTAGTSLDAMAEKFAQESIRRLVVVDGSGLLIGVVSWKDVAARLSNRKIGQMVEEVVESPPKA